MNWQFLFLSSEGRIGQKDFWIGALLLFVAWILSHALHILAPLIWLLLVFPWVCIIAKRLHDFGRSGWLMLAPLAVGVVAVVLAVVFGGLTAGSALYTAFTGGMEPSGWAVMFGALGVMFAFLGVAALVKILFLLWVGLTPGDPGANRFGPAPGAANLPTPATPAT